jgi:hypothetical protein
MIKIYHERKGWLWSSRSGLHNTDCKQAAPRRGALQIPSKKGGHANMKYAKPLVKDISVAAKFGCTVSHGHMGGM